MITMSVKAFLKMKYLTMNTDEEVQAFLIGDNKNRIYIEDLYVLEQEVSSAHTEVDSKQIAEWINDLIKQNKTEIVSKIIGTFHSHNTMSAFWSATDNENIEMLGKSIPIVVSVVSSKQNSKLKLLCRVDFFKPMRITVDEIDYEIENADDFVLNKVIKNIDFKIKQIELSNGVKINFNSIEIENDKIREEMKKEIELKCKKPEMKAVPLTHFSDLSYGFDLYDMDFETFKAVVPDDMLMKLENGIYVEAFFVKQNRKLFNIMRGGGMYGSDF